VTPAIKLLEKLKVPHEVHRYTVSGDEEGTYGEAVACAIGVGPNRVFKTLVAKARHR
jgi:Cys-tRNA(Pro)/Cys-tRNA(Cys) deacylase